MSKNASHKDTFNIITPAVLASMEKWKISILYYTITAEQSKPTPAQLVAHQIYSHISGHGFPKIKSKQPATTQY